MRVEGGGDDDGGGDGDGGGVPVDLSREGVMTSETWGSGWWGGEKWAEVGLGVSKSGNL